MKLDDRRAVIEVLLCVGMEGSDDITKVATALGVKGLVLAAHCCWAEVSSPSPFVAKSSPTLRLEWFVAKWGPTQIRIARGINR